MRRFRHRSRCPRNRCDADRVAACELRKGFSVASTCSCLGTLCWRQLRGTTHMLPSVLSSTPAFGSPGADEIALDIREATEDRDHQPAGAGARVRPGLRNRPKLRSRINDFLYDAEQVEGAPGKPVDPGYSDDIPGPDLLEQLQKLSSVGPSPAYFLLKESGAPSRPELIQLGVESLAVGADSRVSDTPVFNVSFDHIFRKL